jgi:hypothetical protein
MQPHKGFAASSTKEKSSPVQASCQPPNGTLLSDPHFREETAGQGRSASHSSGRGTLHTPQAARRSHRIAPREGRSRPAFAPSHHHLSSGDKANAVPPVSRGAELITRATLFFGRRTAACQLLSRVLPPRRIRQDMVDRPGPRECRAKEAAAGRAARSERRASQPLGLQRPAQCPTRRIPSRPEI